MLAETSKYDRGISDEEALEVAQALAELTRHPAWAVYQEVIRAAKLRGREEGFEHPDQIQRYIGYVEGLEAGLRFPHEIIAIADQAVKKQEARGNPLDFRGPITPHGDPSM